MTEFLTRNRGRVAQRGVMAILFGLVAFVYPGCSRPDAASASVVAQRSQSEDTVKAFIGNIEEQTEANRDFRHVISTGPHLQLVLMSLQPGEDIGEETHEGTDQFFRVEEGEGEVVINGVATRIERSTAILVPAGTRHNVRNTGDEPLKFYTLYAPPQHPEGTIHRTRADAMRAEHH